MGLKLHPRTMPTQRAEIELKRLMVEWQQRHDLTYVEAMGCILRAAESATKYALRTERHPDDPDKGGDEE